MRAEAGLFEQAGQRARVLLGGPARHQHARKNSRGASDGERTRPCAASVRCIAAYAAITAPRGSVSRLERGDCGLYRLAGRARLEGRRPASGPRRSTSTDYSRRNRHEHDREDRPRQPGRQDEAGPSAGGGAAGPDATPNLRQILRSDRARRRAFLLPVTAARIRGRAERERRERSRAPSRSRGSQAARTRASSGSSLRRRCLKTRIPSAASATMPAPSNRKNSAVTGALADEASIGDDRDSGPRAADGDDAAAAVIPATIAAARSWLRVELSVLGP